MLPHALQKYITISPWFKLTRYIKILFYKYFKENIFNANIWLLLQKLEIKIKNAKIMFSLQAYTYCIKLCIAHIETH